MSSRLHALTILAADPDRLGQFWRDLLDGSDVPVPLVFEHADLPPRSGPNQVHVHLTSYAASQQENVDRALSLGATHLDVGQLPEEDHVVLADPEGNEFCVIPETNNWLAGTAFLGELAADGTREVGVFWSEALGWPLVHDEDGETAIRSPDGRMIVAWGGPPLNERHGRNRMHLVLSTDDLEAEVTRLVSLGATEVSRSGGRVELADPDGNELWLRSATTNVGSSPVEGDG